VSASKRPRPLVGAWRGRAHEIAIALSGGPPYIGAMAAGRHDPREEDPQARRARYLLYVLGGAFVALGFSLEMVPPLAAVTSWWAGRACALVGAIFLAVGRYGSDRVVRRCGSLLSGWP
jgi:hypothetical protein